MPEQPPASGAHEEPPREPEGSESRDVVPYEPPVPANAEASQEEIEQVRGNLEARDQVIEGEYTVVHPESHEGSSESSESPSSDTESSHNEIEVTGTGHSKKGDGHHGGAHDGHSSHGGPIDKVAGGLWGFAYGFFAYLLHLINQMKNRAREMSGGGGGGHKAEKSHGGVHH